MKKYDYLIVESGLFGATFAYRAKMAGKRCLVIKKRSHIGGNVYCDNIEGINIHKYGAHIFHTSNKEVWDFVNSIVPFNRYTNSPLANYKGKLYNLPFNMNTFHTLWGVRTPEEAKARLDEQKAEAVGVLDVRSAIKSFLALLDAMGIQRPAAADREKELEILSMSVNPVRFKNNPVELDEETIRSLYDNILR